jgi:SanA protein
MTHRSLLKNIVTRLIWPGLTALLALVVIVGVCDWRVERAASGRLYYKIEDVPRRDWGLLLGAGEKLGNGDKNWFFQYRVTAAAELYKAGKIKYVLVSGDNHTQGYDEPAMMTNALKEAGVPGSAIFVDDAGFRTLDSVIRAKVVFELQEFTIISQKFHDQRALLIARHAGIDAIGFCAQDVEFKYCQTVYIREALARVKAILDLYVLHTGPKFLGAPIKLPI